MKNGRRSSQRRHRWSSIGSAAFAITMLAVLGLGGGFLLALLPSNSVDRSATVPRNLPEFQSLPLQHSTPSPEPLRDAENTKEVFLIAAAASTMSPAAAELNFKIFPASEFVESKVSALSPTADSVPVNSAINIPVFGGGAERFSTQVPPASKSAVAFEALQTESIPEPATWTLVLFGILLGAFVLRSRRQSRPAESQDWIR